MSKYSDLRKKIFKDLAFAGLVLLVAGGLTFGLDTYLTSKAEESKKLKSDVQSIQNQTADLERKINLVTNSLEQYQRLKTDLDQKRFQLDRDLAKKKLDEMRRDFRLSLLTLEISPETAFDDPQLTKFTTTEATYSDMKITFSAITDLHVYAFLDELPRRLPGFIKLTDISITRSQLITDDSLIAVGKGEEPQLVQAEIHALWVGLRLKDTMTGAANAPH